MLLLGVPGLALSAVVTALIISLRNDRQRRDLGLLRLRGATPRVGIAVLFGLTALVDGVLGSALGFVGRESGDALLTGPLEPTNEAYAIAKIAGIKLCQAYAREYGANFISAMPTNLYGPNDNFDLLSSHVLPALLRKAHEAKKRGEREMLVWGSGRPRREFLHVDDLAAACLFLLEKYDSAEIINVGCGEDISIRELAELICEIVGFQGDLVWDATKPDGTPRKLLDVSKLHGLGWRHTIALREGIARTYEWFLQNAPQESTHPQ